jgi:hypothetical protein
MCAFEASSRLAPALWIAALVMGLAGCGSSGHDGGGLAVSFDGSWQGTWSAASPAGGASPPASGVLTLELDQLGTSVTGTAVFAGHSCLATCAVACQVKGHEMSGWLDAGLFQMAFSGSCSESGSGSHHADNLTATYQIHDGACAGESGVIQLLPASSDTGHTPEFGAVQIGELVVVDPEGADVVWLPVFQVVEQAR